MSKSPGEIIKSISREKVRDRLGSWHEYYLAFVEPNFKGIFLNLNILRLAAENYFRELERLKTYHGIDFADAHKRAAFTMVAVSRAHPIQLSTDVSLTEALILINEWYGLQLGLSQMDIEISKISPRFLRNMIYLLYYRDPDPESLASSMYLVDCAFHKKAVCDPDADYII